jgi:hypothetical protein
VIQRAFEAGVRALVITGTSMASSQEAQRIAWVTTKRNS